MTLIKRNVSPSLPRFFDDFFTKNFVDWNVPNQTFSKNSLPAVNILEKPDVFHVELAAPGMQKQDFKIELKDETLLISSEKKLTEETEEGEFTRREFSFQSFQRSLYLPKKVVDIEEIKASYEDGILRIEIPKKVEAKALPPREIAIQ